MPRFVLLHHEMPAEAEVASHWDLMFERDGVLWTWRLKEIPAVWQDNGIQDAPGGQISWPATRLAHHRLAYLEYEGPVSGDRGQVRRVDRGEYRDLGVSEGVIEISLWGEKLSSRIRLEQVNSEAWRMSLV